MMVVRAQTVYDLEAARIISLLVGAPSACSVLGDFL